MGPGDVIAGRFEIERIAGLGGMGTVFQGKDVESDTPVAVKILFEAHVLDSRFEREAQLLSDLRHPGLVRYVAHGVTDSEKRYMVMEWLEGEDLSRRLARERLRVDQAVTLISRVAEALAAVHARGVVHRDLKPSNIFLVGGSVEDVRVLDFGVARFTAVGTTTVTGTVLGTPGYMAPEQARSGQHIDSRADVFAMGAVLFEALTGSPAFEGKHLMAMLAKILFEDAPRVADLRPEVPEQLDEMVARMLAKNPNERPHDGAAVMRAIASLGAPADAAASGSSRRNRPVALTGGELRLLSVVLIGQAPPGAGGDVGADRRMRDAAEARGGRFERLAEGSALVSIAGTTRIAGDQAAHAARCALALHAAVPSRPLSLATGRAAVTGRLPVGEAIDRAVRLLLDRGLMPEPADGRPAIAVDEVTAGLLDARFEVESGPLGFVLHGERPAGEGTRTLLGTTTVCVGRDREIATLDAMFVEAVEGPSAQVVLVTAPAGAGKSRVVQEALRAMRRRGEVFEVWMGRGDSLHAGSAFSVLGQALRAACGVVDGEHLAVRQNKIRTRVGKHVPLPDQPRVAEFLGEIVGTPFPDDDSVALRAARQDALLMGDQMRRAFEDFLRTDTAAQPVVFVFEDLQWGDLPSVRFVDHVLRTLRGCPVMVIGVARPEVYELFPKLWEERGVEHMRLKELTPKACERLVRQVLGDDTDQATVERLVTQADGHAFFLEELIRAVAEGRGDALPETVLATVEARFEGLEVEARRVLRAGSIFGAAFWPDGVRALLGSDRPQRTLQWLATMVEREVLVRRPESRFPGDPEYAFRHALLREASYAMLTDGDRVVGHRLAAEWLERHGESDPMVLAEHFERGQLPERAGVFYLRAAELAQRGNDTEAMMRRAQRGLECDVAAREGGGHPPASVRVALLGILCEARSWRREWAQAEPLAEEVMRLAPPGSQPWSQAAPAKLTIALSMGRDDEFMATLRLLQTVEPAPGAVAMVAFGLATGSFILACGGQLALSAPVLRRLEAIVAPVADRDPVARAWLDLTHAFHDSWGGNAFVAALSRARAAHAGFTEAGHSRGVAIALVLAAMNEWFLGQLAEAERDLNATLAVDDEELGLAASTRAVVLVGVLADKGTLAEARTEALRLIERGRARGRAADEARARWLLAEVLRRSGDFDAAEREIAPSIDGLAGSPLDQAAATATYAAVLLGLGRSAEALTEAHESMDHYVVMGALGYRGLFARLTLVEALEASGKTEAARSALAVARDRLMAKAAAIADPDARRTFLTAIPENARTMALAEARLGPLDPVDEAALPPPRPSRPEHPTP